jgi:hypothetical protein
MQICYSYQNQKEKVKQNLLENFHFDKLRYFLHKKICLEINFINL